MRSTPLEEITARPRINTCAKSSSAYWLRQLTAAAHTVRIACARGSPASKFFGTGREHELSLMDNLCMELPCPTIATPALVSDGHST